MRHFVIATATAVAVASLALVSTAAQTSAYKGPRTPDGKPDLNGIWQVFGTASWDIRPHSGQMGVPAGSGVVEGDDIPYQPWAAAKKKENFENRMTADPLAKCFLPGVPRVTYLPFAFEITQTPKYMAIAYEYHHTSRIVYTDGSPHAQPLDLWMGDSRGRWEGDTLIIDVTDFNDQTWFDMAGNFHSDALHVVGRYMPMDPDHMHYEATIEDPKVFTRPWKMSMIIYRRLEKGLQLFDYDCVEYFWVNYMKRKPAKALPQNKVYFY